MSIQHHNKFNFLLLKTLAKLTVLTSLFGSAAGRRHYEPPEEDNVFSPPVTICETNQDGFGGTLGAQFFTLTYNYELEVLGPGIRENDLDDILFALERNIANFFLRTQDFRDTECGGQSRRLRIISSSGQEETTPSTRRLRPIGISTNPPDGPTGCESSGKKKKNGIECYLDAASLKFYHDTNIFFMLFLLCFLPQMSQWTAQAHLSELTNAKLSMEPFRFTLWTVRRTMTFQLLYLYNFGSK